LEGNPMRLLSTGLFLTCLACCPPAPADAGGREGKPADFRVVFRYRAPGPASVNDYESEVTLFERLPGGGEKRVGTFRGSIFPDDLPQGGRLKDGTSDLYLGLHRRSRDGKALTPTPADLVVKTQGWLRPALIVNADGVVPVLSRKPGKTTARLIHLHN